MTIEIYRFQNADGIELDRTLYTIREARDFAKSHRLQIIAHTFEWADSEMIEDYTPVEAEDRE